MSQVFFMISKLFSYFQSSRSRCLLEQAAFFFSSLNCLVNKEASVHDSGIIQPTDRDVYLFLILPNVGTVDYVAPRPQLTYFAQPELENTPMLSRVVTKPTLRASWCGIIRLTLWPLLSYNYQAVGYLVPFSWKTVRQFV